MADTCEPYVLRADGLLHSADVRSVAYCTGDLVASASRDQTAQVISLHDNAIADAEDKDELVRGFPITGHTAFVNFVFYHPGLPLVGGKPCVVTGGNDHHVAVWRVALEEASEAASPTCTLEAVLDGHAQGVCAGVYVTRDRADAEGHLDIVTGDWSGACIVFDSRRGRPKQLYTKHATAVRGVAHLPHTTSVVTCSADKTIHQWDVITGQTLRIFQGHEDVVQCVCAIDAHTFATGSNDSTVRVWRTDAPQDAASHTVLVGHSSLVYTVAWHDATQELLSASEDRSVCVWRRPQEGGTAFELRQAVHHPCVVWSVAGVSQGAAKGDILTGGSDGVVRLWTRNDRFMASIEKLERLEQGVSSQRMDVKVAHAAGLKPESIVPINDLHLRQGQREGDRVFARNEAGTIEVYTWSGGRWDKIGDVVAGPSQAPYTGVALPKEKQIWNGKAYDYLFDVDVQGTMLKLPYNAGDSILETARQFIADHPGQVSIDNVEAIQSFLLEHIDPADVAKVPGLAQHGAASPALTAKAHSVGDAGDDVGPNATPAMPTPWTTTEVFTTFKLEGAIKKVGDVLAGNESDATRAQALDLLRRVHDTVSASAQTPAAVGCLAEICTSLCHVFLLLPVGSRFPMTDALRYVLAASPAATSLVEVVLQNVGELLAAVATADNGATTSLAASDAEALVWVRVAACLVAALAAQPRAIPASAAHWLSDEHIGSALRYLFVSLPRAQVLVTATSGSAPMKAAITALVRNQVVFARRLATSASGGVASDAALTPLVQWLVMSSALPLVAQRITCESIGSPLVLHDLTSLWTLYAPPTGDEASAPTSVPSWLTDAKAEGRTLLGLSLRALATGADPHARHVAKALQALLEA